MDFSMTEQQKKSAGLVSVIMPVYNCKKYLERSVGSLLAQTYGDIEVICINDGSTDGSLDELNRLAAGDGRVRVVSQKNSGPATARNAGLAAARGKWLMFCDSDDWYDDDAVEQMLGAMLANDADMVSADNRVVWENGTKNKDRVACVEWQKLKITGTFLLDKMKNRHDMCGVVLWGRLFRMDIIRRYDIRFPDGYEHDDTCFMSQCYAVMKTMFGLDRVVYNYVVRRNSIMDLTYNKKNSGKEFDCYHSMAAQFDFLQKNNLLDEINSINFIKDLYEYLGFSISYVYDENMEIEMLDLYRTLLHKFGIDALEKYRSEYFYGVLSALAAGDYFTVMKYLKVTPGKYGNLFWAIYKKTGVTGWRLMGMPVMVKVYKTDCVKWRLFNLVTVKKTKKLKSGLHFEKVSGKPKPQFACIQPVFDNAVTIFMATNNNYAPNCGVMLQSIKDNASQNRNYDVVISSSDVSDENKHLLMSMAAPNISVRLIDAKDYISGIDMSMLCTGQHFSQDTYFRFFIPQIFAKYGKVLYLDVDMVALHDVAELFDVDIGDNWWGVAHEKWFETDGCVKHTWANNFVMPYIKNTLKMTDVRDYFQAGVMIWNVKQCRKDNVMDKCLVRLRELGNPLYVDQDVMNSVANGRHIHYIDGKWNVEWNAAFHWYWAKGSLGYETLMDLLKNPFILHYASSIKPWNEPWRDNAHYFWEFARKTPFYEIMLHKLMHGTVEWRMNANSGAGMSKRKIKRKIAKYKILQTITFGGIKSFKQRKAHWRQKLDAC